MDSLAGKIKLDFRASEPIYLQIARQIQQLVTAGDLHQGDQLPTVRELATELRINFNTVARAYRMLDESRLISTQRGRGTYIWETPSPQSVQELRQVGLQELAQKYLEDALQMGFSPQEALETLKRCLAQNIPDPEEK
ncbi:MAG: GntR family transcriptional regulator [Anaerolineaceae bacterium]